MSIREILTRQGKINVGGQEVTGSFHPNESRTTPVAFHLTVNGLPVIGYGATREEAKRNAEQYLNRPPTPPSSTDSLF